MLVDFICWISILGNLKKPPGINLVFPLRTAIYFVIIWTVKESAMNEIFFLVEEAPEGGYTAKALSEPIFTDADSLDELHTNVRDAVRCHFEEGRAPKMIRLHFVHEEVLAV